jgi:hypothetical protein
VVRSAPAGDSTHLPEPFPLTTKGTKQMSENPSERLVVQMEQLSLQLKEMAETQKEDTARMERIEQLLQKQAAASAQKN